MPNPESQPGDAPLSTSFQLAGRLVEAESEASAIQAALQISARLIGASGATFVPFSEFRPSLPPLAFGDLDRFQAEGWRARLTDPGTRHACRLCEKQHAGPGCVLSSASSGEMRIYCVGLQREGREVGVINYYAPAPFQLTDEQHAFLAGMVRLVDTGLSVLRAREARLDSLRRASLPAGSDCRAQVQRTGDARLLEELEYRAVLDERSRLAREIHDGLAQTLAFLKLEAARMQKYVTDGELEAVTQMLRACYKTLSDAYLDARQAIDDLRQAPTQSMEEWLRMTAEDFQSLTGIPVDVSTVSLRTALPPSTKAQLIRIVQEALTNIRKHAHACQVTISAFERGGEAVLEVRDNGAGFDVEQALSQAQFGLRSMRERAESIQASLQVDSAPGQGATVRLRVPILEVAIP